MKWTNADRRRRWFGLFYLIVAIGMVIWGQTLLSAHLNGLTYLIYWITCFVFTLLAMLTAALDLWVIRLRQRRSENDAAREALKSSAPPEVSKPRDQEPQS